MVDTENYVGGRLFGKNEACTVHFALCQPLPANVCCDDNNTGICKCY